MKAVLVGLLAYLGLGGLWQLHVRMTRPDACPKGHTDHYHCNRWTCRVCAVATFRRGLRRRARERSHETAANRDRG